MGFQFELVLLLKTLLNKCTIPLRAVRVFLFFFLLLIVSAYTYKIYDAIAVVFSTTVYWIIAVIKIITYFADAKLKRNDKRNDLTKGDVHTRTIAHRPNNKCKMM